MRLNLDKWKNKNLVITTVYGILPAFILKIKNIPFVENENDASGYESGPVILLSCSGWESEELVVHALTHVKQWYRTFGRHCELLKDIDYRVKIELEAVSAALVHNLKRYEDYDINYYIEFQVNSIKDNFVSRGLNVKALDAYEEKLRNRFKKYLNKENRECLTVKVSKILFGNTIS
jgi:hypothetical protein